MGGRLILGAMSHDPTPDEWGALEINILRNWSMPSMLRLRQFLVNRTGGEDPHPDHPYGDPGMEAR